MTKMTHDRAYFLEKRASFFRAVSAVTPFVNEELDERTRQIIHQELAKMNVQSPPKKPSVKSKVATILPFLDGFSDEVEKIANLGPNVPGPSTVSSTKSLIPRNSMRTSAPSYTHVNPSSPGSPAQQHQPVLSSPPVRR